MKFDYFMKKHRRQFLNEYKYQNSDIIAFKFSSLQATFK